MRSLYIEKSRSRGVEESSRKRRRESVVDIAMPPTLPTARFYFHFQLQTKLEPFKSNLALSRLTRASKFKLGRLVEWQKWRSLSFPSSVLAFAPHSFSVAFCFSFTLTLTLTLTPTLNLAPIHFPGFTFTLTCTCLAQTKTPRL